MNDGREYHRENSDGDAPTVPTTMPPVIAEAINKIMGDIQKIGKEDKNEHGNYKFAKIDDFLEATRPLCAKHGLLIMPREESVDHREGGKSTWLVLKYRFILVATSGEIWDDGCRTIMANSALGSQAFGAAQSYVLKQYMRSLFQMSTGDKEDLDYEAPETLASGKPTPDQVVAKRTEKKETSFKAPWKGPQKVVELKGNLKALMAAIAAGETEEGVEQVWLGDEYKQTLDQARVDIPDWYQRAESAVNEKLNKMLEKSNA